MRHRVMLAVALVALLAVVACGGDDGEAGAAELVEAREENQVRLDGIGYRVPIFRQLNPRTPPDDAFYDGPSPSRGKGVYAAFVVACNRGSDPRTPSDRIFLEDAFGQRFEPVDQPRNELAYEPRRLEPGDCMPSEGAATRTDGAVAAFRVPFDDAGERPFVLVIEGGGDTERRIELDL